MVFKSKWVRVSLYLLCLYLLSGTKVWANKAGQSAYQTNCKACHVLDKFTTGPSLVYIRDTYPKGKSAEFLAWVKSPGKKNPDTIQMPAMAHLDDQTIKQIHQYILLISQHIVEQKSKPKFKPFKAPAKAFPYVTRKYLPFTNPASIVVSLTPEFSVVWDSDIARVRYVLPTFANVNGEKTRVKNKTQIIYQETSNTGFSFSQGKKIDFNGYELIQGYPNFHYQVGDISVTEKITLGHNKHSFTRHFKISGLTKPITLNLTHLSKNDKNIKITPTQGELNNHILRLSAKQAAEFSIEVEL